MATVSVPNSFVSNTTASADEVNANFAALVSFLNDSTVHTDGSTAFTSNLDVGTNKIVNVTAPTASTDAATKAYVDALVAAGAIGTSQIADLAITTGKIALDAIDGTLIADNAIKNEHIGNNAIDASHFQVGAVDSTAIATNAVTSGEIAPSSVNTSELVDGAVTNAKLDSDAVGNAKIIDGAVGNAKTDVSAWTNATLVNGWATYTGRQAAQYRKRFDVVDVRFDLDSGTATAGTTIFTLPASPNMRPPAAISIPIFSFDGAGQARVFIDTDGTVKVYYIGGSTEIGAVFSFSVSA